MSNLFKALKEQYEFMQAYLGTILQHQDAIIKGNIEELEETIKSEGALLIILENYQQKIVGIIKELSSKYSLGLKDYKLSEFISAVNENDSYDTSNLSKMRTSLTKMGIEITKINNQNKLLVDQARYIIKETIGALVNANKVPTLDRTI